MEVYSFIGLVRISLCKDDIAAVSAGSYANTGTSIVMVVSLVHGVKLEWERPFQLMLMILMLMVILMLMAVNGMLSSCHT